MEEEVRSIRLPEWEMIPDIGLYMDQVITLMERTFSPALPKGEITKSMVNNYVKVELIPTNSGKSHRSWLNTDTHQYFRRRYLRQ